MGFGCGCGYIARCVRNCMRAHKEGSFFWGYDLAGNTDPSYNGLVSTVGTIGTQVTTLGPGGDTGSLGTAIGTIPAPGALALLGLCGLVGRRRR